jgi:hypothetical protein
VPAHVAIRGRMSRISWWTTVSHQSESDSPYPKAVPEGWAVLWSTHQAMFARSALVASTSVLDQAADLDRSDMTGCRDDLRKGEADIDQR